MAHNKEKYQLIETDTETETMIELADKDIKIAILSMLHILRDVNGNVLLS